MCENNELKIEGGDWERERERERETTMLSTKTQVAISHLGEKYVSYNGERPKLRMGQGYKKSSKLKMKEKAVWAEIKSLSSV